MSDIKIPTDTFWKTYKIIESENGTNIEGGSKAELYYDLLIEYINQEKYLEVNYK